MRKIYLTLVLTMAFTWVSAQNFQPGPVVKVSNSEKVALAKTIAERHQANKAINSRWYDYASTLDFKLGNVSTMGRTFLFPDSNILANFAAPGDGKPWIHGIATIIDPKSDWFEENGMQLITDATPYTLDSVTIYCKYYRNTVSTIVDTMRFEFFTSNVLAEVPNYYYSSSNIQSNYGVDTLWFKGIKRTKIVIDAPSKVVYNLLLNEVDSTSASNGFNIFSVAPSSLVNVAANEIVGVAITFHPGYSYTPLDTLNNFNYVSFYSYEENGDNTYPNYTKRDWNTSQIIPSWATVVGDSYEDIYVPEFAFVQAYGMENHLIEFLLTADAGYTAIEKADNNVLSMTQNQPNPFTGTTTVAYTLDQSANVVLDVYNVAGSKVMSLGQGNQAAGTHTIQIEANDLQAGIYYYTLTADGYSTTKKMVVY